MTNHPTSPSPNRTIPDAWLPAARVGWLLYALFVLVIHVRSLPRYLSHLQMANGTVPTAWEWPTVGDVAVLQGWGIPLPLYAAYIATWSLLFVVVLYGTGLFVFWRRSHEVVALLVALALLSLSLELNSIDDALTLYDPRWAPPTDFNQMIGVTLLLWIGYLFPDGYYQPPWTKWLATAWIAMNLLWFVFPDIPLNHIYGETANRTPLATFLLIAGCFLTGTYAQFYRYRHMESAEQRAQTRWVLLGFLANFVPTTLHFVPLALFPQLLVAGAPRLIHILIAFPLANLAGLTVPITLTIALLRYRLWLVDPILNRAMVYTLLIAALTGIYGAALFLTERLLRLWLALPSELAIFAATVTAALLFLPAYHTLRRLVDRTFQREQIDVQTAFRTLQGEIRTIIALPELLQRLVARITEMLHATHGAIYLAEAADRFTLTESHGAAAALPVHVGVSPEQRQQLAQGLAVKLAAGATLHTLLIPLTAPQTDTGDPLVGILALGRRANGQPYTRDDRALLETMGVQAGTALTVARLVAEEQSRTAWRTSAAGRAATLAAELPTVPQALLPQLHELATRAHNDLETANTLRHLADAFTQRGAALAATLANGYYFLATGGREPAMIIVGLRTLVMELAKTPPLAWPEAAALQRPLATLLAGLQAETWLDILPACANPTAAFLHRSAADIGGITGVDSEAITELQLAQQSLQSAVAGLTAYAQTATVDDQLGLLVQTLDQLNTMIHYLPGALSPPVQTLVQRIAEHWRALITRQAAALRRQAQVVATLVTRRVFAPQLTDEHGAVTVIVALVNQGRGEAVDINVHLDTPLPHRDLRRDLHYDRLGEGTATLPRLAPGERRELAFTFVPTAETTIPLHFTIHYGDEESAAKQLRYHETVHLLPAADGFQPIPNPYVAGAPLRPHSATFVGRQSDMNFIHDALASRESNMALVLTGERRMGKTSLLQQLLVQIDAAYVPVYLDCQALAIEPGLGHLLFDLAEAIAVALEMTIPAATAFAERPSAFFERTFLPQVQQTLGQRRLLLLFDEFEELEARVDRERLEPELFPYLRHLIQHSGLATNANLMVLFAGTHQLHELNPDYWSAFFNVAHHRRLTFLQPEEARLLILQPVAPHLHYDDLALDQMFRLTGGHPYFLQLLCHVVVNEANREERTYVTLAHIHRALEGVFDLATSHLLYLWSGVAAEQKPLLVSAARVAQDGASFYSGDLAAGRTDQATQLTPQQVTTVLQHFVAQEILQPLPHSEGRYRFTLDLLRRWIARQLI